MLKRANKMLPNQIKLNLMRLRLMMVKRRKTNNQPAMTKTGMSMSCLRMLIRTKTKRRSLIAQVHLMLH